MAGNSGEEDLSQKAKEVQKEQQTEAEATDYRKSVPKVTNTSKELYIYIYIYLSMINKLNKHYHLCIIVRENVNYFVKTPTPFDNRPKMKHVM